MFELFLDKNQLYSMDFSIPGQFVSTPLPNVNSASPLRSCVDSSGTIHVYYISHSGILSEVVWNQKKYTWQTQAICSLPSKPSFLFPSKMFPAYSVAWDYDSLVVCKRENTIELCIHLSYTIPNIVEPMFTCMRLSWKTGRKEIWRMCVYS